MTDLIVILQTFQRTEYALRTIKSNIKNLHYTGGEIKWWIADDGSDEAHYTAVCEAVQSQGVLLGAQHAKRGYGANANEAWSIATTHGHSPVTLWLEDDWELKRPLDITPYMDLLLGNEEVGMVRLGYLPVDLQAESVGYDGRMYLNILKNRQYTFSGNPHLKGTRFKDAYGPYPTGNNPGATEIAYDSRIRFEAGPQIWWPLIIGDDPPYAHIGQEKSY